MPYDKFKIVMDPFEVPNISHINIEPLLSHDCVCMKIVNNLVAEISCSMIIIVIILKQNLLCFFL